MQPLGHRAGKLRERSDYCQARAGGIVNSHREEEERPEQEAVVSSYQHDQVILFKAKITAKAECVPGNPLLVEKRGIGSSYLQALLWGYWGPAGDRLHLAGERDRERQGQCGAGMRKIKRKERRRQRDHKGGVEEGMKPLQNPKCLFIQNQGTLPSVWT